MGYVRWVVILAVLMAGAGCVKVDQTLTLEQDGSGTLAIRYGMAEQTIAQLEAMEQMSRSMGESVEVEDQGPFDFDEDKVRADFAADKPDGVELVSVSSELLDGWKYMNIELRFDDLAALKQTELFEDSRLTLTRNEDGNYLLSQGTGSDVGGGEAPGDDLGGEEGAAMMQQMAAMFAGMRIAMTVVVPGEIITTNATEVSGQTASWVFDVDEDPTVLTRLDDMDLEVVFAGKGLSLAPVTE